MRVTRWPPLPSLPSSSHVEVTYPFLVGENRTVSWTEVFGAIVSGGLVLANWVSGLVNALKPFVLGGVDRMIRRGKPPWSPRSNLNVALEPTATLPKLSTSGAVLRVAGGFAEPERATPKFPALVSRVATLLKTWAKSPEELGGWNTTLKVSVPPFG